MAGWLYLFHINLSPPLEDIPLNRPYSSPQSCFCALVFKYLLSCTLWDSFIKHRTWASRSIIHRYILLYHSHIQYKNSWHFTNSISLSFFSVQDLSWENITWSIGRWQSSPSSIMVLGAPGGLWLGTGHCHCWPGSTPDSRAKTAPLLGQSTTSL